MVTDHWQKDGKDVSTQTIVTFNGSCDSGCLTFKFLESVTASCLSKLTDFGRKSCNFDEVKKLSISQGSAWRTHVELIGQTSSGFRVPHIIKLGSFLTEL